METALTLHLTGIRPMLMHNGRLSNPLDPNTRAVAKISKKRNKTDADYAQLALLEARGGLYETPEGDIGLPYVNVWRCLFDAAKAFKLGEAVKQALIPNPDIAPLLIKGARVRCDGYFAEPEHIKYMPVVVNRRRTMRARPLIPAGWEATVIFTLLSDVLQPERLEPVCERAGRLVGLGDWRPIFGTFAVRLG